MTMSSTELLFLKLGGSLITDKTQVEAVRIDVVRRLVLEIKEALSLRPDLRVVLGNGSGSFGHVAGAKYGTRQGVHSKEQWAGYAEVSSAAARLNAIVREAMLSEKVPALTLQPSASAECLDGKILNLGITPIRQALAAGLMPIVYGDVAFDSVRGGTIISTEEILSYLAGVLRPSSFLLAGETDGVLDSDGQPVPEINPNNLGEVFGLLGRSRGTDVTGGMVSKVNQMVELVEKQPGLTVRIFSGMVEGQVRNALIGAAESFGTVIRDDR